MNYLGTTKNSHILALLEIHTFYLNYSKFIYINNFINSYKLYNLAIYLMKNIDRSFATRV